MLPQPGDVITVQLKHKHTLDENTLTTTRTINYQYEDGTKAADSVNQTATWKDSSDTDDVLAYAAGGTDNSISFIQSGSGYLAGKEDANGNLVVNDSKLVPATGDSYDVTFADAKDKATITSWTPDAQSYPELPAAKVAHAVPDKTASAEVSALDSDGNPVNLTDTITYTVDPRTPINSPQDTDLKQVVSETVNYVDATGNVLKSEKNVDNVTFYRTATAREGDSSTWDYSAWTTQPSGVSQSSADEAGVIEALNPGYLVNPNGFTAKYLTTAVDGSETGTTNTDVTINGSDENTDVTRTILWTPVTYTPTNNPNNLALTHKVTETDTYASPVNKTATKTVATFYRTATLKDSTIDPLAADSYTYTDWTTNDDGVATTGSDSATVEAADALTPTGYTAKVTTQVDAGTATADNKAVTVTAANDTIKRNFTYTALTGTVNVHYVYQGATGVKLQQDDTISGNYGYDYVPDLQDDIDNFTKYGDGTTALTDVDGTPLDDEQGALDTTKLHFVGVDDNYGYQINDVADDTGVDAEFNTDGQDVWLIFDAEPKAGKSAYDLWKAAGNDGDVTAFLESLKGANGKSPVVNAVRYTKADGATGTQLTLRQYADDGSSHTDQVVDIPDGTDGQTPDVQAQTDTDGNVTGYLITVNGKPVGELKNGIDGTNGTNGDTIQTRKYTDTEGNVHTAIVTISGADGSIHTQIVDNGKDGKDGADGKDGINGKDGKDGVNGQNGKDGADGKDGKDGVNGQNGKDGADGKDGKDGVNGQNGKDGVDGKDGKDGVNGQNGKDGVDGINGTNGVDGKDGVNGTNGHDGKDGVNGTNGHNGADGTSENTPDINIGNNNSNGGNNININIDGQGGDHEATGASDHNVTVTVGGSSSNSNVTIDGGAGTSVTNEGGSATTGNNTNTNTNTNVNGGHETSSNGNTTVTTTNNNSHDGNTTATGGDNTVVVNNGNDGGETTTTNNNGHDGNTTVTGGDNTAVVNNGNDGGESTTTNNNGHDGNTTATGGDNTVVVNSGNDGGETTTTTEHTGDHITTTTNVTGHGTDTNINTNTTTTTTTDKTPGRLTDNNGSDTPNNGNATVITTTTGTDGSVDVTTATTEGHNLTVTANGGAGGSATTVTEHPATPTAEAAGTKIPATVTNHAAPATETPAVLAYGNPASVMTTAGRVVTAESKPAAAQLPQAGDDPDTVLEVLGVGLTAASASLAYAFAKRKRRDDENGEGLY